MRGLEAVEVGVAVVVGDLRDVVLAGLGRPPRHAEGHGHGGDHAAVVVGGDAGRADVGVHVLQDAGVGVVVRWVG